MYGSFREEQFDIFDPVATKVHDDIFEEHWNSSSQTSEEFTEYNFEVPYGLKGLDGKPLEPDNFIKLIRNIISIFFDSTVN